MEISYNLEKWLDSKEFYELMQTYRHLPLAKSTEVLEAFYAIKDAISTQVDTLERHIYHD